MIPFSPNPFTAVYDALWTMVERNTMLMELIRANNRVKYDDVMGGKKNISDGDLPELVLLSSGGESNVMNSSGTSKFDRKYTWALATGEYQINPYYNTVSWELYRAMVDWDKVLCALVWPVDSDWHYVVRTNLLSVDEGTMMIDENRGISGWAGMWQIDVEMHFRTESLRIET